MTYYEPLWLFCALVFGVVVLPGLDMARHRELPSRAR